MFLAFIILIYIVFILYNSYTFLSCSSFQPVVVFIYSVVVINYAGPLWIPV